MLAGPQCNLSKCTNSQIICFVSLTGIIVARLESIDSLLHDFPADKWRRSGSLL
ncbi:hypothetical protein Bpfe_008105, partial [Biomphalaria pfeifferi]